MKKTNKLLSLGIILCMLFSLAVVHVSAATGGSCGKNLNWTLDDSGVLIISGTGNMDSFQPYNVPWLYSRDAIKTVIIESGVTSIGSNAFLYCSNLISIMMPESIIDIGNCAFSNCKSLTTIEIPDSVMSIGYSAFEYCVSLTTVIIGNNVSKIDYWAFLNCSSLIDVYYDGSEQDWSEISIDSRNVDLISATIHYSYSAKVLNGNIVLQAQLKDVVSDENLHMAIYSEDNILLDYIILPQFGEFREVNVVFRDIPEAKYAKVFLWNSLSSLEPIAKAKTVSIIRE